MKNLNQFENAAISYARYIRNPKKRAYALAYARFRAQDNTPYPDAEDKALSYMAGQAVRMQIEELWRHYMVTA